MKRLENKVAIVTGGSRGIGYATVQAFLREGATVILAASSPASAQKAVDKLRLEFPNAVIGGIGPDLSNYEEVKAVFDEIVKTYGKVDILVNNAGMAESTPFLNYTEEIFDKVIDLNIRAMYHTTRAIIEHMAARGSGVILNTSSMVGQHGQPAGIAYPTSKFAVNGFTRSLARELGPKGTRVNAVGPGITETDMMKAVPKAVIDPLIAEIPLRRLGQPEDIANAFLFLASDEASYITGTTLAVDGAARS